MAWKSTTMLNFIILLECLQLAHSYRINTVDLLEVQNIRTFDDELLKRSSEDELAKQFSGSTSAMKVDNRRQLRLFWFLSCMTYCAVATVLILLSYRFFGPGALEKETKIEVFEDELATDSEEDSEMEEEALMVSKTSSRISSIKASIKLSAKSAREKKLRKLFKTQWLRQSSQEQLGNCAQALLVALFVFLTLRLFRRYKGFRSIHFETDAEFGDYVAANVVEGVACFIAMGCAFYAIRVKSNIFYWPAFLFFCFYILACNLPPFQLSCTELQYTMDQNDKDTHWFVKQAHKGRDCTLQGITAQQTFLCAILVLPFLVPRQKMLSRFAFAWVAIYVAWTWIYHYVTGEATVLTIPEHICRAIVLCFAIVVAIMKKFYLEKSQRNIFVNQMRQKDAVKRLFFYFQYMVPEHVVVPMITNPDRTIAESVDKVSILFILISDFDEFASTYAPQELLKLLNEIFSKCDEICKAQGVTKIETVGEEYVACVGVIPSDIEITKTKGHGEVLKKLFLAADKILKTQNTKLKFKMGMHTGPVVAGVIGKKLPRFRLFGDTINTSARMMQKSVVGKLQFGTETYNELPLAVVTKQRGEIEMKGKGSVMTYFFEGIDEGRCKTAATSGGESKACISIWDSYCKDEEDGAKEDLADSDDGATFRCEKSQKVEKLQLDDLLKQVEQSKSEPVESSLSFSNPAAASALASKNILSAEAEEEWFIEYHANRIVKKFENRLNKQIGLFAVLTVLEISFMVYEKAWAKDLTFYGLPLEGWVRIPVFLGFRIVSLVSLLFWRFVVVGSEWLRTEPHQVQTCILVTASIVCVFLFFSYGALANMKKPKKDGLAPFDQFFNLNFIIAFYLLTGQQNLTFKYSLFFVVLAFMLMGFSTFVKGGMEFQLLGKFFLVALAASNSLIALKDEQSSREQYKARQQVADTKRRIEGILNTLMPPQVVEQLRRLPPNSPPPSHDFKEATIAQSDLCGFTKLASSRTPVEVVEFMSELFGAFDELTDQFGVYKVETIGDAYIAGMAENMLTLTNKPANVILFGLAMVDGVNAWAARMGVSVRCRVGVHHGACVGGIVGNDMQRYHLFGHLMSGVEVLESTAPEGMVQVSPACKTAVEDKTDMTSAKFVFELRKEDILQTSKGEIHDYEEVGGRTWIVLPQEQK